MNRITTLLALFITLTACQNNNQKIEKETSDSVRINPVPLENPTKLRSEQAKVWLTEAIITYFNSEDSNMELITTPQYAAFKMDAMNVDLDIDGSLTQAEFEKKWADKHDLKTHPTRIGFLISGNDWVKIDVTSCMQKKDEQENDNFYTFKVLLEDKQLQSKYNRDILVEDINGKFFISDVLEYD